MGVVTEVKVGVAESAEAAESIAVTTFTHAFRLWGDVALEQEEQARQARAAFLDADDSALGSEHLGRECRRALVAITASAQAIDTLYDALATSDQKTSWHGLPGQSRRIFACLQTYFQVGTRTNVWPKQIKGLFAIRNGLVHAQGAGGSPVPHPTGNLVSPEVATYTVEAAMQAVDLLLDVLTVCAGNPKPPEPDVVAWAARARDSIDPLVTRSADSRQQYPARAS